MSQTLKIQNSMQSIASDVSQGSVLEPLVFLIDTVHISQVILKSCIRPVSGLFIIKGRQWQLIETWCNCTNMLLMLGTAELNSPNSPLFVFFSSFNSGRYSLLCLTVTEARHILDYF